MERGISQSELEVMLCIWRADAPVTVRDILCLIGGGRSYQTIQTFVNRLHVKGFLNMAGRRDRSFTYTPAVTRAKYAASVAAELLDGSAGASAAELVMELDRLGVLSEGDRAALRAATEPKH